MMWDRYIGILVIFLMAAAICGTVSAATGIVANTRAMAVGNYPVCTAPCECISENTAGIRWGAQGYEKCSKTICGQDEDGTIQYYCIHKIGSTVPETTATATVRIATATTTVPVAASQETENAPVTSAAVPATPSPARPAGVSFLPKIPVGSATIIAAVGIALLAAVATGRK